jgi:hypothetical protein
MDDGAFPSLFVRAKRTSERSGRPSDIRKKEGATTHAGDRREPQQKLRWKMEEERWKNKALYGWSIVN